MPREHTLNGCLRRWDPTAPWRDQTRLGVRAACFGASGVKAAVLAERLRSGGEDPLLTTNRLQRGKRCSTSFNEFQVDSGEKMRDEQLKPGNQAQIALPGTCPGEFLYSAFWAKLAHRLSSNKERRKLTCQRATSVFRPQSRRRRLVGSIVQNLFALVRIVLLLSASSTCTGVMRALVR